ADRPPARRVGLGLAVDRARLAVLAVLAEVAGLDERLNVVTNGVLHPRVHVGKLHGRPRVDRSPLFGDDGCEPFGVEGADVHTGRPPAPHVRGTWVDLRAVEVTILCADLEAAGSRWPGNDVDHPTHRLAAIETRRRAVDDCDAVGLIERHARQG